MTGNVGSVCPRKWHLSDEELITLERVSDLLPIGAKRPGSRLVNGITLVDLRQRSSFSLQEKSSVGLTRFLLFFPICQVGRWYCGGYGSESYGG